MARPTCDDNHLYGAVLDMRSALEFESPTKAIEIGKKALRPRQDRTLDAIASKHDDLPTRGGGVGAGLTEERIRKRERDRSQPFKLTRPEALLAPANVIAVFLRDQPMWGSWRADARRVAGRPRQRAHLAPNPRAREAGEGDVEARGPRGASGADR